METLIAACRLLSDHARLFSLWEAARPYPYELVEEIEPSASASGRVSPTSHRLMHMGRLGMFHSEQGFEVRLLEVAHGLDLPHNLPMPPRLLSRMRGSHGLFLISKRSPLLSDDDLWFPAEDAAELANASDMRTTQKHLSLSRPMKPAAGVITPVMWVRELRILRRLLPGKDVYGRDYEIRRVSAEERSKHHMGTS